MLDIYLCQLVCHKKQTQSLKEFGNVLPSAVLNALCLAIYGMFIAIIAIVAKDDKKALVAILIAIVLSVIFYYVPLIKEVSSGIAISVSAVVAALICAFLFPVKEVKTNE